MGLRDWVQGIFATALAVLAMSIFAKITWSGWDALIQFLVTKLHLKPEIEYILGAMIFLVACTLGLVQLKKIKKKIKIKT